MLCALTNGDCTFISSEICWRRDVHISGSYTSELSVSGIQGPPASLVGCDAWINALNNYVLWLHGCIIISIYQLAFFSKGRVHSLPRCLWRINRCVLDCITDIVYPHFLLPSSPRWGCSDPLPKSRPMQFTCHRHHSTHKERKPLLRPLTSHLPHFCFKKVKKFLKKFLLFKALQMSPLFFLIDPF